MVNPFSTMAARGLRHIMKYDGFVQATGRDLDQSVVIWTNALCCAQAFVITSPVRQYAACAGLVTVIAGCCAAKCCIWALVIAGPMQQYAAYAGPAHRNHKPYVATCGIWALVIKGPVQQYAGYASPVHCTCKFCAVIWHMLYLGLCNHRLCAAICWPCVVRRQALCRNVLQKYVAFLEVSFAVSKQTQTPPLVYTSWRDGLRIEVSILLASETANETSRRRTRLRQPNPAPPPKTRS